MSKNNQQNNNYDSTFANINQPLKDYFHDPKDLYLPGGKAEQYAWIFKSIKNHQMRKILDSVKEAKLYAQRDDFENAKKQMFIIVAMTAYNSGRDKALKKLYLFIKNTINEQSIKSKEDIFTFDEFFTSVVAYHKQYSK